MTATETLLDILELVVHGLVDDADGIEIKMVESQALIVFEIASPEAERGKIIGRYGRNLQAVRTIMSAVGAKHRKRVQVEIIG